MHEGEAYINIYMYIYLGRDFGSFENFKIEFIYIMYISIYIYVHTHIYISSGMLLCLPEPKCPKTLALNSFLKFSTEPKLRSRRSSVGPMGLLFSESGGARQLK